MKKKALRFGINKTKRYGWTLYFIYQWGSEKYQSYSCRKSALRGARRYAKRNGYTEVKEV